jgi:hypothetical protein
MIIAALFVPPPLLAVNLSTAVANVIAPLFDVTLKPVPPTLLIDTPTPEVEIALPLPVLERDTPPLAVMLPVTVMVLLPVKENEPLPSDTEVTLIAPD